MRYKKPSALNGVTFLLLLLVGLGVYLLVYLWPVYSASSRVKGILWDHIPALYKANLRNDDVSHAMIEDMKSSISTELQKARINDKAAKILIYRSPRRSASRCASRPKRIFRFPIEPSSSSFPRRWFPTPHGSTGSSANVVQSSG